MILNKIEDPRDALAKAHRYELYKFAQHSGVNEITHDMPASIMRKILRGRGFTRINIPARPLGAQNQGAGMEPGAKGVEVNADDDLMRQWLQQKKPVAKSPDEMGLSELRKECTRLNIKMIRGDNTLSLREKIKANGKQDAA